MVTGLFSASSPVGIDGPLKLALNWRCFTPSASHKRPSARHRKRRRPQEGRLRPVFRTSALERAIGSVSSCTELGCLFISPCTKVGYVNPIVGRIGFVFSTPALCNPGVYGLTLGPSGFPPKPGGLGLFFQLPSNAEHHGAAEMEFRCRTRDARYIQYTIYCYIQPFRQFSIHNSKLSILSSFTVYYTP